MSIKITTEGPRGEITLVLASVDELTGDSAPEEAQTFAQVIAKMVNQRGKNDGQMLEVSPEKILEKYISVVALRSTPEKTTEDMEDFDKALVGYVGALPSVKHTVDNNTFQMTEIGSLKVVEECRQHGIGRALFERIVQLAQLEGLTPYAFCNNSSLPLALAIGGREASSSEVPPEAFELCKDCPMYCKTSKANPCCDTVVVWDQTKKPES